MAKKRDYLRRYHFNRYKSKRFKNPYFQQSRKHFDPNLVIVPVVGLIFIALIIYFFGFASFRMIRAVNIEGLEFMSSDGIKEIVDSQLSKRRFLIFPQSNAALFRLDKLREKIEQSYSFDRLDISLQDKVLSIYIKEKISKVIWRLDDNAFYVDLNGVVIHQLSDEDKILLEQRYNHISTSDKSTIYGPFKNIGILKTFPILTSKSNVEVSVDEQLMQPGSIENIIKFNEKLREHGLLVNYYFLERKDSVWVKAETEEGFAVLFDTTADVLNQSESLFTVLDKQVKDRSKLEYIDVRFGDHIYIKGGD